MKSSLIIDELPTIYIRGLDNLIAMARSNKVSVCLGIQDFSQLERDYGEKESKVIINTVGNIFSGQVVGDTARTLSERFGKIVQLRESHSVSNDNVTTSTNTQLESLIPASKISNLTQGMFVGAVADRLQGIGMVPRRPVVRLHQAVSIFPIFCISRLIFVSDILV